MTKTCAEMLRDKLMSNTYHVHQPRDYTRDISSCEDVARDALRSRPKSNIGAWALTVAAIAIGAIGGTHLSNLSGGEIMALFDTHQAVETAIGVPQDVVATISLQAAGDGLFYSDVEIAGQIFTMQIDPTETISWLNANDKVALDQLSQSTNTHLTLPYVQIANLRIDNVAFQTNGQDALFSVIGLDLLSQLGSIDWTGPVLNIVHASDHQANAI